MPNCYQLIRKSDPESGPVKLNQIDEEMCQHFLQPVHPKFWFRDWYNLIGYELAMGRSLQEIREWIETFNDPQPYLEVVDWLDANFIAYSWAER